MEVRRQESVLTLVKSEFPDCVSLFTLNHPITNEYKMYLILESVNGSTNQKIVKIINETDNLDIRLFDELKLWPYNESPLVLKTMFNESSLIQGQDISDIVLKSIRINDYHVASFSNLVQTLIHIRKSNSAFITPDARRLNGIHNLMLRALVFGYSSINDVNSIDEIWDSLDTWFDFDLDYNLRTFKLPDKGSLSEKKISNHIVDMVLFVERFFREVQRRGYPPIAYELEDVVKHIRLEHQTYDRALQKTLEILKGGVDKGLLSSVKIHGAAVNASIVSGWSDLDIGVVLSENSTMDRDRLIESYKYIRKAYQTRNELLSSLSIWQHTFDINSLADLPYLDQWYWHSMRQETVTLAGKDYLKNLPNMMKLDNDYIRAKWISTLWDFRKIIARWEDIDSRTRSCFFVVLMSRPMTALFCLGYTVTKKEGLEVFESIFGSSLTAKMNQLKKIREDWPNIRENKPLLREYAQLGLDFNEDLRDVIFS
jgi:hypothetical protein